MGKFRLEQVKPGMLLSQDAKTLSGELILPGGSVLSEKHIKTLRAWGIPEVAIQSHPFQEDSDPEMSSVSPELIEAAEKEVETLFSSSNGDHPAIQELRRLALKNKLVS